MEIWIIEVKRAIDAGNEHYKHAADTILRAMRSDTTLTQKAVAEKLGRSESWVSRLLKWHREGCLSESVFGPEIALRRSNAKSQPANDNAAAAEKLGQLDLYGGSSRYVPGEHDATINAIAATATCKIFVKQLKGLSRENLLLVFQSEGERHRQTLEALRRELQKLNSVKEAALGEIEWALNAIPPDLPTRKAA